MDKIVLTQIFSVHLGWLANTLGYFSESFYTLMHCDFIKLKFNSYRLIYSTAIRRKTKNWNLKLGQNIIGIINLHKIVDFGDDVL